MATSTAGRVGGFGPLWHPPHCLRLFEPLGERDFALLWAGTLVSLLGDGIYLVALPFAVLELDGSPTQLSLVGVAWSIGMVGFLLLGGLAADRYDKRRQLLVADAVRLAAVGAIAGLSLGGVLEIWQLAALGFVFGAGEGLSGPAMGAIVPELVPEELTQIRMGKIIKDRYPELAGTVDVVTCNPPYIPDDQVPVDPEVRDHDPLEALYGGGADGLARPLEMAARAAVLLRDGGTLVMEHAETQGASLPRALAATGDWGRVVDHVDLLGRPRCVVAERHRVGGREWR